MVASDQKATGDTPLMTHFFPQRGRRSEHAPLHSRDYLGRNNIFNAAVWIFLIVLHNEAAGGSLRLSPFSPGSWGFVRHEQHPGAPGVSVRVTLLASWPDYFRK